MTAPAAAAPCEPARVPATLAGAGAILAWSTTVAVGRRLTEALGTFTAPALAFLVGGLVSFAWVAVRERRAPWRPRSSRRYLVLCGGLFVTYEILLYTALGTAQPGQQVLEVGLINYLWIGLTLVFSVPLLGRRARWPLAAGIVVSLAGLALAQLRSGWSVGPFGANLRAHGAPYALALGGAVCWALYSNLARRLAAQTRGGDVPLFVFVTGLALCALGVAFPAPATWSVRTVIELTYMAVVPSTFGYVLWESAMRRGDVVLVASLSYAIPVLSTLFSTYYLGVPAGPALWAGCAMVTVGAWLGRRGVREPHTTGSEPFAASSD